MSSFVFNNTIPAAPNNPSVDQPDMLTNNISTDAILAVDHISFNTANGGTHKQVTFSSKNPAGVQIDPQSVLFTNSGTVSTVSDLFFTNQNATFIPTTIRAWALCNGAAGGIVATQSMNVVSVVRTATGTYTVTLMTNAVNSTNIAILITASSAIVGSAPVIQVGATYTIGAINVFTINTFRTTTGVSIDPTTFSFQVMQL
jgi:hypothetical protein